VAQRARWWVRVVDPIAAVGEVVERVERVPGQIIPAWQRVNDGEPAAPVIAALALAVVLQAVLPNRVVHPVRWLFPAAAVALLIVIVAAHGKRIGQHRSPALRFATLVLLVVLSGANIAAGARLVIDLLQGEGLREPSDLLLTGGAIWLTNVIIFGFWYWMFDRGGPVARAQAVAGYYPAFLFPQMTLENELAKPEWRPMFFDYVYTSFTNATAFSPTDVMPLARWAKLTMMLQSAVALLLAILVVARAVNVLD
jgi:hypothetical protein